MLIASFNSGAVSRPADLDGRGVLHDISCDPTWRPSGAAVSVRSADVFGARETSLINGSELRWSCTCFGSGGLWRSNVEDGPRRSNRDIGLHVSGKLHCDAGAPSTAPRQVAGRGMRSASEWSGPSLGWDESDQRYDKDTDSFASHF